MSALRNYKWLIPIKCELLTDFTLLSPHYHLCCHADQSEETCVYIGEGRRERKKV